MDHPMHLRVTLEIRSGEVVIGRDRSTLPVLAENCPLPDALMRIVGGNPNAVRPRKQQRWCPARRLALQEPGQVLLRRSITEKLLYLESLALAERPHATAPLHERQGHLVVQQGGSAVSEVLDVEYGHALAVRDCGTRLVGNHVLRVGSILRWRVEMQPPDTPIRIQQVLKLERDLVGRGDNQQI